MVMGVLLFFLSGTYWGVWGTIGEKHFDLILSSLPPWQKQELADALNYYYNHNAVSRNTTGLVLRCSANRESIKKQFNWFYRNAAAAAITPMPTYHQIVRGAYNDAFRGEIHRLSYESTLDYELALAKRYKKSNYFTRKDMVGFGMGGANAGLRLTSVTINPFLGAAMAMLSLIQASLSDTMKAIPGIICFMQIRCWNFIYTFAALWAITGIIMLLSGRRGKGKNKKAAPAGGKKKAAAKKK